MDSKTTVIYRLRLPRQLHADIRRTATALKLRPPEVARVAIARGLPGLDRVPNQPESEVRRATD